MAAVSAHADTDDATSAKRRGVAKDELPLITFVPITNSMILGGQIEIILPSYWSTPQKLMNSMADQSLWSLVSFNDTYVRKRVQEVDSYLACAVGNVSRIRRIRSERLLILAAAVAVSVPEARERYAEVRSRIPEWTRLRYGLYSNRTLTKNARQLNSSLGLGLEENEFQAYTGNQHQEVMMQWTNCLLELTLLVAT